MSAGLDTALGMTGRLRPVIARGHACESVQSHEVGLWICVVLSKETGVRQPDSATT
jgi:hypothetical protein